MKQGVQAPNTLIRPKYLDAKKLDRDYFSLFDQFYHIEETEIKFAAASKNCENKFGSYGYCNLCEPLDKQVNDKVIHAARSNEKRSELVFCY